VHAALGVPPARLHQMQRDAAAASFQPPAMRDAALTALG
jgi:hypothetical protein